MGEGVLYLVINLLMLRFLTFTPVFPPFAACSIDYQLTVINIYWTAALLHSCQIDIQPELQGELSWPPPRDVCEKRYVGLVKPVSQAPSCNAFVLVNWMPKE